MGYKKEMVVVILVFAQKLSFDSMLGYEFISVSGYTTIMKKVLWIMVLGLLWCSISL